MNKTKIILTSIVAIILLSTFGYYNYFYKNNTTSYSENNIQPESYKIFQGSWIEENSEFKNGFTLNADSTASSINSATLLYKRWKIDGNKLILTAISHGNHSASLADEKYTVKAYNQNRILLEKNGNEYSYTKLVKKKEVDTTNITPLNTSFDYFPVDIEDITQISDTKHPIDFSSNPRAKKFETAISEQYNSNPANFAGYYLIATWGCGSGCLEGAMIDTRDGKVYYLPTKEGKTDFGNGVINQKNSILLATSFVYVTPSNLPYNREAETNYWLWNEGAKEFVHYYSKIQPIIE